MTEKILKSNKFGPRLFNQLITNIFICAVLYVGPTLGLLCKANILHWSVDFETTFGTCAGTSWSREDMDMSSRRIYFTIKPHSGVSFPCLNIHSAFHKNVENVMQDNIKRTLSAVREHSYSNLLYVKKKYYLKLDLNTMKYNCL